MAKTNSEKQVIGLSGIQAIKDYIDETGGTQKDVISEEMRLYLDKQLKLAEDNLSKEYNEEFERLKQRLKEIEESGTPEELTKIQLEIDALNANYRDKLLALDALEEDLKRLSGDFSTLYEGITTGSVFSPGQLDEVIRTALIEGTAITEDMIATPNLFATKIVSLIANMGHLNAGSIDAGTIKGSSIESLHTISGTDDPVWKIDNEGDGWLASKNIKWDRNGKVTFGKDVTLSFDNISDAEDKIGDLIDAAQNNGLTIRDLVASWIADNKLSPTELEQLKQIKSDIKSEYQRIIDSITQLNSYFDAALVKIAEQEQELNNEQITE